MIFAERYKVLKVIQDEAKISKKIVFDELDKCKRIIIERKLSSCQLLIYKEHNKISHPGMPEVIQDFEVNNMFCTVYEYIEGESLYEYIESKGLMSMQDSMQVFMTIADIVKFLHDVKPNAYIHGNINYHNILLKDDELFLVDYYEQKNDNNAFRAPEAMLGFQKSPLQDIYAMGMLLNYMLSGSLKKRIYAQNTDMFDEVILQCTVANFNKRFPNMGTLVNECMRIMTKQQSMNVKQQPFIAAVYADADNLYELALHYSRKLSKKVLIVDADLFNVSFCRTKYKLNADIQCFFHDVHENKPQLIPCNQDAHCNVYIIPSMLDIASYKDIEFYHVMKVIEQYADAFDAVFIRIPKLIYDCIALNSSLIADKVIYILTDPIKETIILNSVAKYLVEQHDVDINKFIYIFSKDEANKQMWSGIQENVYGTYAGTVNSNSNKKFSLNNIQWSKVINKIKV